MHRQNAEGCGAPDSLELPSGSNQRNASVDAEACAEKNRIGLWTNDAQQYQPILRSRDPNNVLYMGQNDGVSLSDILTPDT